MLATIRDDKRAVAAGSNTYYEAIVVSANDYYPFGMTMPGRKFNSGAYRYGFNGKENDKEIQTQDYGMRIYNPALGKFLSVDPLTGSYPYYTPYQFAGNMPIAAIDLDGLEQYIVIHEKTKYNKIFKTSIYTLKTGTELRDQRIKKINNSDGSVTEPIAKGNVLVFETFNFENIKQKLKIVEKRNNPESTLSSKEEQILKNSNQQIQNAKADNRFTFPDSENPQFISNNFDSPKFYEASKIEPLSIQGYTSFNPGGFKTDSWNHGTIINGKSTFSDEFTDYLSQVQRSGTAKSITVTLNLFTQNVGYTNQQKENVKREYKRYVSRISGISLNNVNVLGTNEIGDSNKSTVKIEVD